MKRLVVVATIFCLALAAFGQEGKAPETPKLTQADIDKGTYAVGLSIAKNLEALTLSPAELDRVIAGMRDGYAGKPQFPLDQTAGMAIQALAQARMAATAEKEKAKGAAFLAKASQEKGAIKTASGAIYIPSKEGTGPTPTAADKVKVHYVGTLVDGKEFDSSRKRGEPSVFPLGGVIKCWTEGLQKIKVGGQGKLICPSEIAYGERGQMGIPGNAVLIFDVELLEIVKDQPAPVPPASKPAPPTTPKAPAPAPQPKK